MSSQKQKKQPQTHNTFYNQLQVKIATLEQENAELEKKKEKSPIRSKTPTSYTPLAKRYQQEQQQKKQWLVTEKQKQILESEEKELKGVTFHPLISPYAKQRFQNRNRSPQQFYNDNIKWRMEKKKQIDKLKDQLDQSQQQYPFQPSFCEKSQRLMDNTVFFERLEQKEIIKQINLKKIEKEITPSFKPDLPTKNNWRPSTNLKEKSSEKYDTRERTQVKQIEIREKSQPVTDNSRETLIRNFETREKTDENRDKIELRDKAFESQKIFQVEYHQNNSFDFFEEVRKNIQQTENQEELGDYQQYEDQVDFFTALIDKKFKKSTTENFIENTSAIQKLLSKYQSNQDSSFVQVKNTFSHPPLTTLINNQTKGKDIKKAIIYQQENNSNLVHDASFGSRETPFQNFIPEEITNQYQSNQIQFEGKKKLKSPQTFTIKKEYFNDKIKERNENIKQMFNLVQQKAFQNGNFGYQTQPEDIDQLNEFLKKEK